MDKPRTLGGWRGGGGEPTTLFGGWLRCSKCGGSVILADAKNYACGTRKDRGPAVCTGVRARRDAVEATVVGYLREQLLSPTAIDELERAVRERLNVAEREKASARRRASARLGELEAEISRLVEAIGQVGVSPALAARLKAAEVELAAEKRPQTRADVSQMPAAIRARAKALVDDLGRNLMQELGRSRAVLQEMLGDVQLVAGVDGTYIEMENAAERLVASLGGVKMDVVAGTGFEPVTFGL
jgi:hypothetical protein